MRILHITDRLSARGGADWHLLGVLAKQAKAHTVHLAVAAADGTAEAPCPVTFVPGLDARAARPVDLTGVADSFASDVVHLHNVVNPEVLQWAGALPAVMTVQDHRCFCPGRGKVTLEGEVCTSPMSRTLCARCFDDGEYFERIFEATGSRLAGLGGLRLTVLSEYMKRELAAVGVPVKRIHVIPPFVHGLDAEAEAGGPPCVLFSGRLVKAKGVWDAVEAWRCSGVKMPLVFAGTGAERNRLEAAGFEVTGWLGHQQLSALYRRAVALVFPPRWQEPFGISGLEALAMGLPVAAWESGGVSEWHPGGEMLVPWGDVDALAGAIRAVVGERGEAPHGFDAGPLMNRLDDVYESLL